MFCRLLALMAVGLWFGSGIVRTVHQIIIILYYSDTCQSVKLCDRPT